MHEIQYNTFNEAITKQNGKKFTCQMQAAQINDYLPDYIVYTKDTQRLKFFQPLILFTYRH